MRHCRTARRQGCLEGGQFQKTTHIHQTLHFPQCPVIYTPSMRSSKTSFSLVVVAPKPPRVTNPSNVLSVVHWTGCALCAGLSVRHGRGAGEKRGSLHSTRQQRAHAATRERDRHTGKTETEPGQTWGLGKKWNRENLRKFPRARILYILYLEYKNVSNTGGR